MVLSKKQWLLFFQNLEVLMNGKENACTIIAKSCNTQLQYFENELFMNFTRR